MNKKLSRLAVATLAVAGALGSAVPAAAQVAGGTTTVDTRVTESTRLAVGWSVKKTLMGKSIYNVAGEKIGKVDDLIISPDGNVSYVIVGAGGFIGIGRHDVAIPIAQIQEQSGRIVMPGATKDMIKAMPQFAYATDTSNRDAFVAAASKDIARGKAAIVGLEKKAGGAAADAQSTIAVDINSLRLDVKSAEAKLSLMTQATAARWKEFEADVNAATARLRKSVDKATG